jgi:hypothetical protein
MLSLELLKCDFRYNFMSANHMSISIYNYITKSYLLTSMGGVTAKTIALIVVEYTAPTNQRYRDECCIKTRLSGRVVETLQDKYKRIWREITINAENNTKSFLYKKNFV